MALRAVVHDSYPSEAAKTRQIIRGTPLCAASALPVRGQREPDHACSGSRLTGATKAQTGDLSYWFAEAMMSMKEGFNEAPPTKKPSMLGCERSSLQLSGETLPPYWMRTASATSALTAVFM